MHGKQEVPATLATLQMAPYAIPVHTPAGHHAMDVRVVGKVGSPGVEDGAHASLQALLLEEFAQGGPCRPEHAGVKQCLPGHGQGMEAIGDGEHHMEVFGSRDDLLAPHPYPFLPLLVLALRAMPVAATVVAHMRLPAIRARLHMAAKGAGAACGHRRE